MTRGDRAIVLVVVAAAVLSVPLVSLATSGPASSISVDSPAGHSVIALAHDGTYMVEGRLGRLLIDVTDGKACCAEAPCPDQVCVRAGVARPGRPVVCAPNGVSISLASGEEGGLDAVSR